ncbi:MAG: DUF1800 family protein [Acidobacteriota bacterium]
MKTKISQVFLRVLTLALALGICPLLGLAQEDPDPNSPTPVLLSAPDSTRALAVSARESSRIALYQIAPQAFAPDSKIVIYVSNIDVMKDEGASAFRVYAEDSRGREYVFPVDGLKSVANYRNVYAVTLRLTDQAGYWEPPLADGDILLRLTWRGLTSNRVRLGLGSMGGTIQDDPGAVPTPVWTKGSSLPTIPTEQPSYVGYKWSGDRLRFMEQATFGQTPALDSRIRRIGLRAWLSEQFQLPYPSAGNPYPNQPLKPGSAPADCDNDQVTVPDVPVTCYRDTYSMYQPQAWFLREALYGDAQLRHRMAWALAQIWVTSGVDVQQGRHMVEYHKVLSANAFGNYRTLMKQMTLNPTMGDYLSMDLSTKNNPNENYAREVMQLFTVGLFMLKPNGTLDCLEHPFPDMTTCASTDTPIPTYDQTTVNNMTKVLTGWTECNNGCPNSVSGTPNYIDPMVLVNGNHDLTAKTLLNYNGAIPADRDIAACTGCTGTAIAAYASASMDHALDNIFNHPNLPPYISRILIQQLVTSNPTPAYVGRVAAVFANNGFGVRGDLQAVIKAILLDVEARGDVKTDPNYGKLREPVQLTTNVARNFGVASYDGTSLSDGVFVGRGDFNGMSQIPFFAPTVFNFYPPSYEIPGTGLNGPEFALMTTSTSIQRANFINTLIFNRINVSNPNIPNGTSLNFTDLQAISTSDPTGNLLLDELNRRMMHSTMSSTMRSTILTAVTNIAATTSENYLQRAKQAVYLIATSSQYQVQR